MCVCACVRGREGREGERERGRERERERERGEGGGGEKAEDSPTARTGESALCGETEEERAGTTLGVITGCYQGRPGLDFTLKR